MKPKRKSVFIGYQDGMRGLLGASGVSVSTGVGDAPEAEAASLSAVGLHMDANDEHDWFLHIPRDLNWTQEIGFRVKYSSASATAADDRRWIILYDVIDEDSAIAIGTTALSTAIADETDNGTADAWQYSPRGILDGNIITKAQVTNGSILALNLELDLDDASEEMNMYGIVMDYMPKPGLGGPSGFNTEYDNEDI